MQEAYEQPTHDGALCLAAIRHAHTSHKHHTPNFAHLLYSHTNPSHRTFEKHIFSYVRQGMSVADVARLLQMELKHPTRGMAQLRDALGTFHLSGQLNEKGVEDWLCWRLAKWTRSPRHWESELLGGVPVEEMAWMVHEAGTCYELEEYDVKERKRCKHGRVTGSGRRQRRLRDRIRGMM